jgi:hypothetical protein
MIPINVYALMRQIPLTNLYNYDIGFNELTESFMGTKALKCGANDLGTVNYSADSRAAFVKMLMVPYAHVDRNIDYGANPNATQVVSPLRLIMNGADGLHYGRPKFISDQLLNKALLSQMYPGAQFQMEAGPATGAPLAVDGMQMGQARPVPRVVPPAPPMSLRVVQTMPLVNLNRNTDQLSYIANRSAKYTNFGQNVTGWEDIGFDRFNTVLVRNLYFTVQMQRLLRAILARETVIYRNVISKSSDIVDPRITEYNDNQSHQDMKKAFSTSL